MVQVNHMQLFQMFRLLHEEGFFVGASTGLQCRSPGRWDLDTPLLCVCVTPARYVSLNVGFAYDRTLANIRKEILMFQ